MERIKSKLLGDGTREIVMLESTCEIRERFEVYDSLDAHTYEFDVTDETPYDVARDLANDKYDQLHD